MPVLAREEENMVGALKDYLKIRKELGGWYVKVGDSYIKEKLIGNTRRSLMKGEDLNLIRDDNETSENFETFFQDHLLEEYQLQLVRKIGLSEIINDIKVADSNDNGWIRKIGLIDTSEKKAIHPFTYCIEKVVYPSENDGIVGLMHPYVIKYMSKLEYYESFNSILIIRIGNHYYEKKKGQKIKEIKELYKCHIQRIHQKKGKVKGIAFENKYLDFSNMKFIKGEYRSEIGLFQYMEDNRYFYIGDDNSYGPFTEKFANGSKRPFHRDYDIESLKKVNNWYGNTIEGQKFAVYFIINGFIRRAFYTSYASGVFWERESTDSHLYICRDEDSQYLVRIDTRFFPKCEILGKMPSKKTIFFLNPTL